MQGTVNLNRRRRGEDEKGGEIGLYRYVSLYTRSLLQSDVQSLPDPKKISSMITVYEPYHQFIFINAVVMYSYDLSSRPCLHLLDLLLTFA